MNLRVTLYFAVKPMESLPCQLLKFCDFKIYIVSGFQRMKAEGGGEYVFTQVPSERLEWIRGTVKVKVASSM